MSSNVQVFSLTKLRLIIFKKFVKSENKMKNKTSMVISFAAIILIGSIFAIIEYSSTTTAYAAQDEVYPLYSDAESFFNDSYVHEIYLYFDNDNWYDVLYNGHANDLDDPYYPARFICDNITFDPIGVNFKGHSSFQNTGVKKSFRIDFNYYNEDITFYGLKKLNLNNQFKDPTLLREKLFLDFASQYGVIIRCVHTRVFVNNEYYGLYTAVEHIDKTFAQNRFSIYEDGNLYRAEMHCTLEYVDDNPNSYSRNFELKTNEEENDWSDLIEFMDVLCNTPASELLEQLEEVFDVESWLYSLALCNLFANLDSYLLSAHNYYIYDRDDTGQLTFLIWDVNEAFGSFTMGESDNILELDPFWLPDFNSDDGLNLGQPPGPPRPPRPPMIRSDERPLMEDIWAVGSYNKTYLRNLAKMIRDGFNNETMSERIEELADLIRDDVYEDPNKETSNHDFDTGLYYDIGSIYGLTNFVGIRSTWLDSKLDEFAETSDLCLNELMTVNDETLAENTGDYDPWVEIYNIGPGLVHIENLYLTDDSNVPDKWEFPERDIDDGEFLLIWLDNETNEGVEHANFSPNSNGGNLYIYNFDGSNYVLIDNITYPMLNADVSYGRFPDGEDQWQLMNDNPTPLTSNKDDDISSLGFNELMSVNLATIQDNNSDYDPWVEIYNLGPDVVNIENYTLTDELSVPAKWSLPEQDLNGSEYLLIWLDEEPNEGSNHANFNLDLNGGNLYLYRFNGSNYILVDNVAYPALDADTSYGRLPDANSQWQVMNDNPTPVASNKGDDVVIPTQLFINEFMADNELTIEDPDDPGDYPDWIELFNAGNDSIDLSGMYLTDTLTDPTQWQFPENTIIEAGEYLLIWADGCPEQGPLHTSFQLNNNGEKIYLISSDVSTLIDAIEFSNQIADFSSGRYPDGGSVLQQFLTTPTPGEINTFIDDNPTMQESIILSIEVCITLGIIIGLAIFINRSYKLAQKRKNSLFWSSVSQTLVNNEKNSNVFIENVKNELKGKEPLTNG